MIHDKSKMAHSSDDWRDVVGVDAGGSTRYTLADCRALERVNVDTG